MKLLIVDDEEKVLENIVIRFKDVLEHNVISATSVKEAKKIIQDPNTDFDVAIFDMVFQDEDETGGLTLLQELREYKPETKSLILTQFESHKEESEKLGSYFFIQKKDPLEKMVQKVKDLFEAKILESKMRARRKTRIDKIEKSFQKEGLIKGGKINNELIFLRRWSSFTPNMPIWNDSNISEQSKGGGYFLIWNKIGIVIDPGFCFLSNLWNFKTNKNEHFEVDDLHTAIITHAHNDHCYNIENIIGLLNRRGKYFENPKDFYLYCSEATLNKYNKLLSINTFIKVNSLVAETDIIKSLTDTDDFLLQNGIELSYLHTKHNELPWSEVHTGVAIKLKLKTNQSDDEEQISIGFTSDTQYFDKLASFYDDVDILLMHFGNLGPAIGTSKKFDKNHLGIKGCYELINKLKKKKSKLFLLGEFGEEEIGKDRIKLCKLLSNLTDLKSEKKEIFPTDIGLRIKLPSLKVYCQENNQFVDIKNIEAQHYRKMDSIGYYNDD